MSDFIVYKKNLRTEFNIISIKFENMEIKINGSIELNSRANFIREKKSINRRLKSDKLVIKQ